MNRDIFLPPQTTDFKMVKPSTLDWNLDSCRLFFSIVVCCVDFCYAWPVHLAILAISWEVEGKSPVGAGVNKVAVQAAPAHSLLCSS